MRDKQTNKQTTSEDRATQLLTWETLSLAIEVWNCCHFRQLRTWVHDNHCYLGIKSDTGQHSQFLRCFPLLQHISAQSPDGKILYCKHWAMMLSCPWEERPWKDRKRLHALSNQTASDWPNPDQTKHCSECSAVLQTAGHRQSEKLSCHVVDVWTQVDSCFFFSSMLSLFSDASSLTIKMAELLSKGELPQIQLKVQTLGTSWIFNWRCSLGDGKPTAGHIGQCQGN